MKILDYFMGKKKTVLDEDNFVQTYINNKIHEFDRDAMTRNLYRICDKIAYSTVETIYDSITYEFDTANVKIQNEVVQYLKNAGYKIEYPYADHRTITVLL